jgi:hypothetical protein
VLELILGKAESILFSIESIELSEVGKSIDAILLFLDLCLKSLESFDLTSISHLKDSIGAFSLSLCRFYECVGALLAKLSVENIALGSLPQLVNVIIQLAEKLVKCDNQLFQLLKSKVFFKFSLVTYGDCSSRTENIKALVQATSRISLQVLFEVFKIYFELTFSLESQALKRTVLT